MRDVIAASFLDELLKTALIAPGPIARGASKVLGAKVVGHGLRAGRWAGQTMNRAAAAVGPHLGSAKRLAVGAGVLAAGTYGLGRGLQAGLSDREKSEKEEANRSARLSGMRPPYAG